MRRPLCFFSAQIISFDQDGVFEGREVGVAKPPVRLLERIEALRVLSQVSEAGLLSSAEEAGLFSKLESAGAFSTAEKLLPLADDLKLLSTAEALLNFPSSNLFGLAAIRLIGGKRLGRDLTCGIRPAAHTPLESQPPQQLLKKQRRSHSSSCQR